MKAESDGRVHAQHTKVASFVLVASLALFFGNCSSGSYRGFVDPCDGGPCGMCLTDSSCARGQRCNVEERLCVDCLKDADCAAGFSCGPMHTCVAGCSAKHGCGDAGACELDGGFCVECLADGDCHDPRRSRCDVTRAHCTPCLPYPKDNCGAGQVCVKSNLDYACAPGCKNDGDCTAPKTCCNGACVDKSSDAANCSACGMACGAGLNCCNSQCSNPEGDILNCGACKNACVVAHGQAGCTARACTVAKCDAGHGDCNAVYADGCETDITASLSHCGACNMPCALAHAASKCAAGACALDVCISMWADCNAMAGDGCETDTGGDLNNCGACKMVCSPPHAMPVCDKGLCKVAACSAGYADCNADPKDGCEVQIDTDVAHCGACAKVCANTNGAASCVAGVCKIACKAGYADCNADPSDGCEVNIQTSLANCGACKMACMPAHATPQCTAGACAIFSCDAGYGDCNMNAADGCEKQTTMDVLNCGMCAKQCSTQNGAASCVLSACRITCNAGYGDCNMNVTDGCETALATDPKNCGACGKVCVLAHATPGCAAGVCKIGSCDATFGDCNANPADGCETSLTTAMNCGACGIICGNGLSCVNGVCGGNCTAVKVNELVTGTMQSGSDEFVEIWNSCGNAVNLTGWHIVYRSAGNNGGNPDNVLYTLTQTIPANGYLLFTGNAYSGGAASDGLMQGGLSSMGGAVGLRDGNQTLIDSVSYDVLTVPNALTENSPAPNPPNAAAPGNSIGRSPNGQDTNNNAADFKVSMTPTPRAMNQ